MMSPAVGGRGRGRSSGVLAVTAVQCRPRARLLVLCAGLLLAVLVWRPAVEHRLEARFPDVPARTLAHALADFNTQRALHPHLGAWTLESERGDLSSWNYSVRYSCGTRCAGTVHVAARDAHCARADCQHVVHVHDAHCTRHALLPSLWPHSCEEWETEVVVRQDGGGALYHERSLQRCGALDAGCAARLQRRRALALQRLQHYSRETLHSR